MYSGEESEMGGINNEREVWIATAQWFGTMFFMNESLGNRK